MHFLSAFFPEQPGRDVFVVAGGDVIAAREVARNQLTGEVDLVRVAAFAEAGAADGALRALSDLLYDRALHSNLYTGTRADLTTAWARIGEEFAISSRLDDGTARAAADAALDGPPMLVGMYPILLQRDGTVRRVWWGQCQHAGLISTAVNNDPLLVMEPEEPGPTLVAQFAAVDPAWARWACRAFERAISAGDAPPFAKAA